MINPEEVKRDKELMIERWLYDLRKEGLAENTVKSYRRGAEALLGYYVETPPGAITPRDVRDWVRDQKEDWAPSTVNTRLSGIRAFYDWYSPENNPAADIPNVQEPLHRPKALKNGEFKRLLRAVRFHGGTRDIAIVEFMLGTGVRVSELLNIKLKDLTINERSGSVVIREGKGGKLREIPLPLETRKALEDYLAEEHPHKRDQEAYLWQGQRGRLRDPSTISRLLDKYAYHAKIEGVSPHILRHTYAKRYLEKNPDDIRGLAQLLGHADIKTTMRYTSSTV
jgi:site-specific recombinase XerD